MGFSVSTTTMFESNGLLRNNLSSAPNNSGTQKETAAKVDNSVFESGTYISSLNPQLSILKASTQISVNNSLNETLKYLRAHGNRKQHKMPVFGELWNIVSETNEENIQEQYQGELLDFKIDTNVKNIFAA